LNRRYGNTGGDRESIMVEINKRTFMDVKSFRKDAGFDAVQGVARTVLHEVAKRARERIGD